MKKLLLLLSIMILLSFTKDEPKFYTIWHYTPNNTWVMINLPLRPALMHLETHEMDICGLLNCPPRY